MRLLLLASFAYLAIAAPTTFQPQATPKSALKQPTSMQIVGSPDSVDPSCPNKRRKTVTFSPTSEISFISSTTSTDDISTPPSPTELLIRNQNWGQPESPRSENPQCDTSASDILDAVLAQEMFAAENKPSPFDYHADHFEHEKKHEEWQRRFNATEDVYKYMTTVLQDELKHKSELLNTVNPSVYLPTYSHRTPQQASVYYRALDHSIKQATSQKIVAAVVAGKNPNLTGWEHAYMNNAQIIEKIELKLKTLQAKKNELLQELSVMIQQDAGKRSRGNQ